MFSQAYYLLRSRQDGQYLVARPRGSADAKGFLLLFKADHEALTYVNQHGSAIADQFAVESVAGAQLQQMLDRWGYQGIGMVKDPLVPEVEFLVRQ